MSRIRRILLPTDFSSTSAAAYRHAVKMATAYDAQLVILHVIEPRIASSTSRVQQGEPGKLLDSLVARAEKSGARTKRLLIEGSAQEEIVKAALSNRTNLLVMGAPQKLEMANVHMSRLAGRLAKSGIELLMVASPLPGVPDALPDFPPAKPGKPVKL